MYVPHSEALFLKSEPCCGTQCRIGQGFERFTQLTPCLVPQLTANGEDPLVALAMGTEHKTQAAQTHRNDEILCVELERVVLTKAKY